MWGVWTRDGPQTRPRPPAEAAPAPEAPAPAAATAPTQVGPADGGIERRGKVLEVLKSGGYTYVRLEACGQEAWAAGPEMDLEIGSTVAMPQGMGMVDFKSPSLGRTFDAILFVDWIRPGAEPVDCSEPAKTEVAGKSANPHGGPNGIPTTLPKSGAPAGGMSGGGAAGAHHGKVVETMVSGGYSYVRIDSCGEEKWLAGPQAPIKVGQFVASPMGAPMGGFNSPSLGRTFDTIFFVQSVRVAKNGPDCG